jgi:hypothetical protein
MTHPTLLNITATTRPITFRARGQRHAGLIWTIQPGDPDALQRTIDMVNENGGPDLWDITEL